MTLRFKGVNIPLVLLLGLGGGFLVIRYGAWERGALGKIPHASRPLPQGRTCAARLAERVQMLAGRIGERNIFKARALESAASYIEEEFRKQGYPPRAQSYEVRWDGMLPAKARNIEAVVPADRPGAPVLVVGAHYDTAPGTPGADDNASGVAALLELAARLRGRARTVELRFVAFCTEEPPFFGSEQMGSARYAASLEKEGRRVLGMISLEMLGYYSEEPRSQTYPPLLGLFYPSRGDYLGFVSNLSSRKFLRRILAGYKPPRQTPSVGAALPQWLSVITLSDHLWFWRHGWPAVMATDTAFLRNPDYHEAGDTPDQLNYERMADAVEGLEASLLDLAR